MSTAQSPGNGQVIEISPRMARRYMNYEILSAVIWLVFGAAVGGAVFSGLLIVLKLTEVQIGYIMSLGLLMLPMQMIGAMVQRRYFHRKHYWLFWVAIHYSCFGVIALLAATWLQLPRGLGVTLFFGSYALAQFAAQCCGAVGSAWLGDVIPPRESSAFWNRRGGITLICNMVIGIAVGQLVDLLGQDKLSTYAMVMGGGACFGLLSMIPRYALADPNPHPEAQESPWAQIKLAFADRSFRQITRYFCFQSAAGWVIAAFYFVYLQREMKFSMTAIQILGAFGCLAGVAGAFFFRVVGGKFGNKTVLIFCSVGKFFEFILYALLLPGNSLLDHWGAALFAWVCLPLGLAAPEFTPGMLSALPTFLVAGFFNVGLGAAQQSILTTIGDRSLRGIRIGIFSTLVGICGFAVSSQSGFFYDYLASLPALKASIYNPVSVMAAIAAVGFLLSPLWLIGFRDEAKRSALNAVKSLIIANPVRAVYHANLLSQPLGESVRVATLRKAHGDLFSNELIRGLYSPSSQVRDGAMMNLSNFKWESSPELETELIKLIDIPEIGMQAMAARTAGRLRLTQATPALIRNFRNEDVTLAQACIFSAGLIGSPEAEAPLCEILNDRRMSMLWPLAAEALSRFGGSHHAPLVFKVLQNERYWVLRQQTLISLGRIMQKDKSAAHAAFENEERLPGSAVEQLLRRICNHVKWGEPELRPSFVRAMDRYDKEDYAGALEVVLLAEFAAYQLPVPANREPAAFFRQLIGSEYLGDALAVNGPYPGINLQLQLELYRGLQAREDDCDRFWLLTALLICEELLSREV